LNHQSTYRAWGTKFVWALAISLLTPSSLPRAQTQPEKLPQAGALPPLVAQQQLSDLVRTADQVTTEIAARETSLTRLRTESEKLKSATEPKALRGDVQRFTTLLASLPRTKEGVVVSRAQVNAAQTVARAISDDVWSAFPGFSDMWTGAASRDLRTAPLEDQYLADLSRAFESALWQALPMRQLEALRKQLFVDQNSPSTTLAPESIPDLKSAFADFKSILDPIQAAMAVEVARQEARLSSLRAKVSAMREQQKQLQDAIEESQSQIDKKIIQWGLPAFGLLLLGILAIPKLYKNEELQAKIFSSGIVLDMFTVFLLTISILLLGLGRKLSENVLGTLLGGIAGYVLGRSNSRQTSSSESVSADANRTPRLPGPPMGRP
jgi:hypothetical protein